MRDSLNQLLEVSFDVKIFFQSSKFELSHYDDGSIVTFKVDKISNPKGLNKLLDAFEYRIFHNGNEIEINIYENFQDI